MSPRSSHTMPQAPFALRLAPALQLLALATLTAVRDVHCHNDCVWSLTRGPENHNVLSNCSIMLGDNEVILLLNAASVTYTREPVNWLPQTLLMQIPSSASVLLLGVKINIPSCELLWKMVERECTSLLSSTWPSPFLETGPAFLYYRQLSGANSSAERVNITCPLDGWEALLAPRGGADSPGYPAASALAPCGTATVSSGQELLEALQQLQANHARVMVTLATNISLPTEPTPQRLEITPDDIHPLIFIYRNVTLAGGAPLLYSMDGNGKGGVELDLRNRRNAFNLVTARRQPRADQQGDPPVLVLTDMQLVNIAPGPLYTWPLGLLSTWYYFADMDRSGTGGLQIHLLRSMMVYTAEEHSYINFWYMRMLSLLQEDRSNASWLQAIIDPLEMVHDDDGYAAHFGKVMDFFHGYNSSITDVPLHTAASSDDFDLWSIELARPLPPSSFATARNATQLLALLQESWTSGPRVILLVANITLAREEWPQGGASLSYNVTLAGPVAGAPVWLDTGGMPLVGTAAATAGSSAATVTLRLLRLRLVDFSPPLLTASRDNVAQAAALGAFTASEGLESWRDKCVGLPEGGADGLTASGVRYEVRACVLELQEARLVLLKHYNVAQDCGANTTGKDATEEIIAAACQLLQPQGHAAASISNKGNLLIALVTGALQATQESKILVDNTSVSPTFVFSHATLGGVVLSNTTVLSVATTEALQREVPACGMESLLLAVAAALSAGQLTFGDPGSSPGSKHMPLNPTVLGGLVGGLTAGLLVAVATALIITRRWRRRLTKYTGKPTADPAAPSVVVAVSTAGSDGGNAGGEANEVATDGHRAAQSPREDGAVLQADSLPFTLTLSQQQGAMNTSVAVKAFPPRCILGPGGLTAAAGSSPRGLLPRDAGWQRPPDDLAYRHRPSLKPLSVVSELKRDIERVREKCQEHVKGRTPRKDKMKLLGCGGFASVYLTEWCGMWVAAKFLLHTEGDTASARQRLTTEAALTMSLDHPHIVPTYDVAVETLGATKAVLAPPMAPPAAHGGAGPTAFPTVEAPEDEDEAAPDYAAVIRLRLIMQYCEGGTLSAALVSGKFGASPDLASTSATPSAVEAAGVTAAGPTGQLRWEDLAPAGNMPLSLLAARDIATALEYLHAAHVVHGDLTETNVLLKAVVPHLPPSIQTTISLATTAVLDATVNVGDTVVPNSGGGTPAGVDVGKTKTTTPVASAPTAPAAIEQTHAVDHGVRDPARGLGRGVQAHAGRGTKVLNLRTVQTPTPGPPVVRAALAAAAGGVGVAREAARWSCALSSFSSYSDAGEGSTVPIGDRLAARRSNTTTIPTAPMDGWLLRFNRTTSTTPSESDARDARHTAASSADVGVDGRRQLAALAARLCSWSFKLSDFGLSVQLQSASQTHMSNRFQGTPVFMAPEVLESGRLSPAADVYSFGVLLWLLLHGISLKQIRPLLPRILFCRPVGEDLLRHSSNRLPAAAVELVRRCLAREPAQRPSATQLKSSVERLLQDAVGPALYQLLMGMERYEVLCGRPDVLDQRSQTETLEV